MGIDDESLAKKMQEEEDASFAVQLQKEEDEEEHERSDNDGGLPKNMTEGALKQMSLEELQLIAAQVGYKPRKADPDVACYAKGIHQRHKKSLKGETTSPVPSKYFEKEVQLLRKHRRRSVRKVILRKQVSRRKHPNRNKRK